MNTARIDHMRWVRDLDKAYDKIPLITRHANNVMAKRLATLIESFDGEKMNELQRSAYNEALSSLSKCARGAPLQPDQQSAFGAAGLFTD